MGESLLEYGVLGIAVVGLSMIVWRFVLLRLSSENDAQRDEITDLRRRYDSLLSTQISDYHEIASNWAEHSAKNRAAIAQATQVMEMCLDKFERESDERGSRDSA